MFLDFVLVVLQLEFHWVSTRKKKSRYFLYDWRYGGTLGMFDKNIFNNDVNYIHHGTLKQVTLHLIAGEF